MPPKYIIKYMELAIYHQTGVVTSRSSAESCAYTYDKGASYLSILEKLSIEGWEVFSDTRIPGLVASSGTELWVFFLRRKVPYEKKVFDKA